MVGRLQSAKHGPAADFWNAVERGPNKKLQELLNEGFDANTDHPKRQGFKPIHRLAGNGTMVAIQILLDSGQEVDLLSKDLQGRLPSQAAKHGNRDKSVWRFLEEKEKEQALERGLDWNALSAEAPSPHPK